MIAKKKFLLTIFLIIIFSFWSIYFLNRDFFDLKTLFNHLEIIQNYISDYFLFSFCFFIFSYFLLVVSNFPASSLLSLIGGFFFGTWFGGMGIILASTMGSFVVFMVAKIFFKDLISQKLLHKYSFISKYFHQNELELMFLIRLIPGIPFFAQNWILAGLGANSFKFFFTTFIGISPWAIIFASIGNGLEEIFLKDQALSFLLVAKPDYLIPLSIIILFLIISLIFKRKIM